MSNEEKQHSKTSSLRIRVPSFSGSHPPFRESLLQVMHLDHQIKLFQPQGIPTLWGWLTFSPFYVKKVPKFPHCNCKTLSPSLGDMEAEKSRSAHLQAGHPESWWPSSSPHPEPENRQSWCNGVSFRSKASRLKTQKELVFQFKSGGKKRPISQLIPSGTVVFLLLKEGRLFVLARPSTNKLRPTHMREGNLLYLVYQFKY